MVADVVLVPQVNLFNSIELNTTTRLRELANLENRHSSILFYFKKGEI